MQFSCPQALQNQILKWRPYREQICSYRRAARVPLSLNSFGLSNPNEAEPKKDLSPKRKNAFVFAGVATLREKLLQQKLLKWDRKMICKTFAESTNQEFIR